jgi:hypothetical protein
VEGALMADPIITMADKLACANRELGKRREVYARLVETGKLEQGRADRETQLMEAIVEDYARAAALGAPMVQGMLLRVGNRRGGASGARLTFDAAVTIAGQAQPRTTTIELDANPYGLRCTWLATGRAIEALRAAGVTSFLPDASQALAESEAA